MIIEGQGYDPNQINTLKNNLQFLTQPDSSEIGLSGGGGFLGSGAASGAGISPTILPQSTSPQGQQAPSQYTGQIFDRSQGSVGGGLLSTLRAGREGQTSRIQDLSSQFRQAAGPTRDFQSFGGSQAITSGLAPGGDVSNLERMLSYQYTGPTSLSEKDAADVALKSGELSNRAGALTSGLGLQSTLLQGIGGLTPGQAQFEAQKLRYDPNFQQKAQSEVENIRKLNALFRGEQESARSLAERRQKEAAGVREQTSGELSRRQTGLLGDVRQEAERRNLQRQRLIDLFDQIRQAGSFDEAPEEFRTGLGSGFFTETQAKTREAEAALQKILQDPYYKDIAEYGQIAPRITGANREWYKAPEGAEEKDIRQWIKRQKRAAETPEERKDWNRKYRLFLQRQADINRLFKTLTPRQEMRQAQGEYAYYLPSGTGLGMGAFQSPDFQPFVSLDAGTQATAENTATDEQARVINLIYQLLGRNQRLGRGAVPFSQAEIQADTEGFQGLELEQFQKRSEELEEAAYRHKRARKKARDRYHKQRQRDVILQTPTISLLGAS